MRGLQLFWVLELMDFTFLEVARSPVFSVSCLSLPRHNRQPYWPS